MPLSRVDISGNIVDQLFNMLKAMHENGIFHGDVKLDNFMLSGDRVYVFDCLKIDRSVAGEAIAFDLASLFCALMAKVPASVIIAHAKRYFSGDELKRAESMIDVALYKVEVALSESSIKALKESFSLIS